MYRVDVRGDRSRCWVQLFLVRNYEYLSEKSYSVILSHTSEYGYLKPSQSRVTSCPGLPGTVPERGKTPASRPGSFRDNETSRNEQIMLFYYFNEQKIRK